MRITTAQRTENENRIRAAMDRLLRVDRFEQPSGRAPRAGSRSSRSTASRGIRVSPRGKQEEPESLVAIKGEIERRWGTIDLLDILKYAEFDTGFIAEFASVATRENLSKDVLRRRLLLVLFGLGTNMGIKRVAVTGKHGESEATLRRVRHRFVNRANMRAALRKLVNATFAVRDEMWWGTGTACASDSRKFGAWSSNLMTEWHQRYRGPGVMIYWHVERKSVCIYSQVKSCSASEVASMLELELSDTTNTVPQPRSSQDEAAPV